MKILGISAFYHDSAAALVEDGEILAAAQEERFTREKHCSGFPSGAVRYCLEGTGSTIADLDAVVFYDKPWLKFERLLETYYGFAPQGVKSFIAAMPVWLREKLFLKRLILEALQEIQEFEPSTLKLLYPEHHLSHAASAFYPSPYEESAILTIDGVGEWATASICHGEGKDIKIVKELRFPHSLGLLYSAFTYFLGFRVNSGEYKLMGLAPYGNPGSEQVKRFVEIIKTELVDIKEDGSVWLNQEHFDYATSLRMVKDEKWEQLFGFPKREPESDMEQKHCDLALASQQVTEEVVIKLAQETQKLVGSKNLCMAGGVALNCVANGKIQKEGIFENLYIQPASGDAGGSVGAALATYHIYFNKERKVQGQMDRMHGSYLGPEFSKVDVLSMAARRKAPYHEYEVFDELAEKVAGLIADGQVIGWFQGRMEFGPRALGNRSILGDARNPEMQKKLNLKIKYREGFRPFAPSVLAEDSKEYFETEGDSPYMLLVHPVKESRHKKLPDNYNELPVMEKLYYQRSDLPAITHIDFSARIQSVHKETNERYWKLIQAFKKLTGYGLIVNTSFNVRGEPIVCTPDDAYKCLMRTEMDYLVVGDFLFDKKEQGEWKKDDNWWDEYKLD